MRKIRYKKGRKVQYQPYEYTGVYTHMKTEMQLFVYNEENVKEIEDVSVENFIKERSETENNWLNLHGLTNIDLIKELTDKLNINSLIVSDILNISRGTRFDELDECVFFSIKSILPSDNEQQDLVRIEQISFLIQDNLLISFQEKEAISLRIFEND